MTHRAAERKPVTDQGQLFVAFEFIRVYCWLPLPPSDASAVSVSPDTVTSVVVDVVVPPSASPSEIVIELPLKL